MVLGTSSHVMTCPWTRRWGRWTWRCPSQIWLDVHKGTERKTRTFLTTMGCSQLLDKTRPGRGGEAQPLGPGTEFFWLSGCRKQMSWLSQTPAFCSPASTQTPDAGCSLDPVSTHKAQHLHSSGVTTQVPHHSPGRLGPSGAPSHPGYRYGPHVLEASVGGELWLKVATQGPSLRRPE